MSSALATDRPVVAVAGATGFVGQALLRALVDEYRVIGLTRSPTRAAKADDIGVEWRHCDLFSLVEVEAALEGVDYAIYLVHSMLPNARLQQASFEDLDVILADNFARAAEVNGVRQILYVGGINPRDEELSRHLKSRLETEATLAARGTPITALRAGIIVGPGGSSMRVLVNLVRRLPAMVLPKWTESVSAPLAIEDMVRAVRRCIGDPEAFDQHFELGGPDTMSYRQMMERTAEILGLRRPMFPVPVFSTALSKKWVATIAGVSEALVGPLIESLGHSLVPEDNWLQRWLAEDGLTTFDQALEASLDEAGAPVKNPRHGLVRSDERKIRKASTVRSVQRLPLPAGAGAGWATDEYMRWLPRFVWPFLKVVVEGPVVKFFVRFTPLVLLELTHTPAASRPDRQLMIITGGLLARVDEAFLGRLEFREVIDRQWLMAAIHDFRPALPWYVYNWTQAVVHIVVMRAFGWHLGAIDRRRRALPAGTAPPLLPRETTVAERARRRLPPPRPDGSASV